MVTASSELVIVAFAMLPLLANDSIWEPSFCRCTWQERGLWAEELKHLSHNFSAVLYIHEGSVFIDGDGREARHRMIDHFGEYIAELSAQVRFSAGL